MIGEPIADDDILDPIVNNAHRIHLKEGAEYPRGQYRSFAPPYIVAAKGRLGAGHDWPTTLDNSVNHRTRDMF
mgnify:CR=1 FL=1